MVEISINFWYRKNYTQRMTVKEWKEVMIDERDQIIVRGRLVHLKAKNMGFGIVGVYMED